MKSLVAPLFVGLMFFLVVGCSRTDTDPAGSVVTSANAVAVPASSGQANAPATDDQGQIEQAIRTHLAGNKGINMAAMNVTVNPAAISGNQAHATADFRLKQGGTSMEMKYVLQRHAGGWIVVSSEPAGGQFAHPPMDKAHAAVGQPPADPQFPDFSDFIKRKEAEKQQ